MNLRMLVLAGITVLPSCAPLSRFIYRANPINLPGLTKKGESRISASGGFEMQFQNPSAVSGFDIQAAYAVSDRITLLGGFSGRQGDGKGDNDPWHFFSRNRYYHADTAVLHIRNNTWELGAAYMILFNRRIFMSLSAGGGGGDFHLDDYGDEHGNPYRCFLDARQTEWFAQPAVHFRSHWVEVGLGMKISGTYYSRVRTNYPDSLQVDFTLNNLDGRAIYMVQPFWVLQIHPHLSWLQLEFQGSLNTGWNTQSSVVNYNYCYLNAGFGLAVSPTGLLHAFGR